MSFYAVRKGIKPGIYTTWEECQEQVIGFKGAEFKKFKTESEAMSFISQDDDSCATISLKLPYAFVDGSYNAKTKTFGYGGFLVVNDSDEKIELMGSSQKEDFVDMRNVAGEIFGSVAAIKKAIELGLKTINIYYDYMGIEMWAKGSWKTNTPGTKAYKQFIDEAEKKISISFTKVAAHTGIPGNELADKLAKKSVGIE